jgi:hypothetical protein
VSRTRTKRWPPHSGKRARRSNGKSRLDLGVHPIRA